MSQQAMDKLSKVKTRLVFDHPFFASIALMKPFVLSPMPATACTDGRSIMFNEEWVEQAPLGDILTVTAEEVMHCASMHPARSLDMMRKYGKDYDHQAWNYACDMALGSIILGAVPAFPMPEHWACGKARDFDMWEGKSAEEIYAALQGVSQRSGQAGEEIPDSMGEVLPLSGESGKGQATKAQMREWEQAQKMDVVRAAAVAKSCGNLPVGLERMVEELKNPVLPWQQLIAHWLAEHAKDDFSWSKVNTRYAGTGFGLPSLYSQRVGRVLWAIDTSGSMSGPDVVACLSEVQGACDVHKLSGVVVYCDAAVCGVQEIEQGDVIPESRSGESVASYMSRASGFQPSGGGGTDFAPVWEWLVKNDGDIVGAVYLTDGYCSSFGKDPGVPVLWVVIGVNPGFRPPFGDVVRVPLGA